VICRNSKLTFRLQDALGGGNSKLLVVACISTARQDLAGALAGLTWHVLNVCQVLATNHLLQLAAVQVHALLNTQADMHAG
jgi:hypothetical protein